jgi:uncharacterized Tic20 family protein
MNTMSRFVAHLLGIVVSVIGALVIWLSNKDRPEKSFVIEQAKEALNFQITIFIATIVSFALVFVAIGFALLPVLFIGNIVFCIIAGIAASKGQAYRYPITLRLIINPANKYDICAIM